MIDTVELLRSLESALRAGYSLRQALSRAAEDFESTDLAAAAEAASAGAPLASLFDAWAAENPEIGLLAGAVRLQLDTETNLADTLSTLHLVLARRP
jgi:Flp pilus assembly protein TadB